MFSFPFANGNNILNHFLKSFSSDFPSDQQLFSNWFILNTEQNSGLYEQVGKLKKDIQNLKSDLARKQTEIDELHTRLELIADADKMLIDYK